VLATRELELQRLRETDARRGETVANPIVFSDEEFGGEGSAGLYPSVTIDGEGTSVDPLSQGPRSKASPKKEKAKARSKVKSKEKRGVAQERARQVS
jgi:hypothetical protein